MADRTTGGSHEQQIPKMSVLQKNFRLPASAISAGVNRWLLLCRFDFHQKTWGLPAWEIHRGWDHIFPNDAGELVSAVAQRFLNYSPLYRTVKPPCNQQPAGRTSGAHGPNLWTKLKPEPRKLNPAFQSKGVGVRVADLLRRPHSKIHNHI